MRKVKNQRTDLRSPHSYVFGKEHAREHGAGSTWRGQVAVEEHAAAGRALQFLAQQEPAHCEQQSTRSRAQPTGLHCPFLGLNGVRERQEDARPKSANNISYAVEIHKKLTLN